MEQETISYNSERLYVKTVFLELGDIIEMIWSNYSILHPSLHEKFEDSISTALVRHTQLVVFPGTRCSPYPSALKTAMGTAPKLPPPGTDLKTDTPASAFSYSKTIQ